MNKLPAPPPSLYPRLLLPLFLALFCALLCSLPLQAHESLASPISEQLASQGAGLGDKLGEATANAFEGYISERIDAARLSISASVERFLADPTASMDQNQWVLFGVLGLLIAIAGGICYLLFSAIRFLIKYGFIIALVLFLLYLGITHL